MLLYFSCLERHNLNWDKINSKAMLCWSPLRKFKLNPISAIILTILHSLYLIDVYQVGILCNYHISIDTTLVNTRNKRIFNIVSQHDRFSYGGSHVSIPHKTRSNDVNLYLNSFNIPLKFRFPSTYLVYTHIKPPEISLFLSIIVMLKPDGTFLIGNFFYQQTCETRFIISVHFFLVFLLTK